MSVPGSYLSPQAFYSPTSGAGGIGGSPIPNITNLTSNSNLPWWDKANNIFGEYGDLIGGGLGILSTGAGIWGLINSERRADKAFEHRRAMDLKNYAAQRQMYANHLESRYNINRGARQARGLDDSGYGTLAQYTEARQIPA